MPCFRFPWVTLRKALRSKAANDDDSMAGGRFLGVKMVILNESKPLGSPYLQ